MIYGDHLKVCYRPAMMYVNIRKNRKCDVIMWWWNSGVKDEIQEKNEAYKEMTNEIQLK